MRAHGCKHHLHCARLSPSLISDPGGRRWILERTWSAWRAVESAQWGHGVAPHRGAERRRRRGAAPDGSHGRACHRGLFSSRVSSDPPGQPRNDAETAKQRLAEPTCTWSA
jgi:hypothetical protein